MIEYAAYVNKPGDASFATKKIIKIYRRIMKDLRKKQAQARARGDQEEADRLADEISFYREHIKQMEKD